MRGVKNINDVGRILSVNDAPMLKLFKQDQSCNVINGTDKLYYPPFMNKSDVMWVYSHDACKSFPLRYGYMTSIRGAKAAWKGLNNADPLVDLNEKYYMKSFTWSFRLIIIDISDEPCVRM